ncbi:MAG: hypothetical protein WCO82_09880, partial [Sphingomonadales bacterium]
MDRQCSFREKPHPGLTRRAARRLGVKTRFQLRLSHVRLPATVPNGNHDMTAANPRLGLSRRHLLAAPFALATASRAAQPTLPPLPPVIDLRALMTPARDQGEVRDTCAHFAFIAAAEAVLARDTGRILPLSEEFLARMARPAADPPFDESTTMVRVAAVATHHGLLPLASMPYQADTSSGCRKGGPSCRPPAAPSPQLLAQASKLKLGGIELTPGYKKFRRTMTNEHCP